MALYNENVQKVMTFLMDNGYCKSSLSSYKRSYDYLQKQLEELNKSYSPDIEILILDVMLSNLSENIRAEIKHAIVKLNDVYITGSISFENRPKEWLSYTKLHEHFKKELDDYLGACVGNYSNNYIPDIKSRIARFLIFCQVEGLQSIHEISYETLLHFHSNYRYSSMQEKSMCETVVQNFLNYYAENYTISHAMHIYLWLLRKHPTKSILLISKLTDSERLLLSKLTNHTCISLVDLWSNILKFKELYKKAGYSKSMRSVCKITLHQLFLFLDKNKLNYCLEISMLWLNHVFKAYSHTWYNSRRILLLFNGYLLTGNLQLTTFFKSAPTAFDQLPEWCKSELSTFLMYKEQEGKSSSAICLYRSSCVRFCNFLGEVGLTNYSEVTVDIIKKFNLNDHHTTAEGKNAYNVRIRKFLSHLCCQDILNNPLIHLALPKTYAPKEKVVVILDNNELTDVEKYCSNASSQLELRRSAMMLLGLRMGMRSSDIVNLQFKDIEWNKSVIHFTQQKTKTDITLPMPIEVGNALYKYLTEGRAKTDCRHLFVNTRTPHQKITRTTCYSAIKNILPERSVPKSGFHVTRKTCASKILNEGHGIQTILDVLGQRGPENVHKYLLLDAKQMKLCSLSLKTMGILMNGGFNND
jgi:site-specific recombinase XerD